MEECCKVKRANFKHSFAQIQNLDTFKEGDLIQIDQFITSVREHGKRCVRIIHGKGYGSSNKGPVIKPLVNQWLRKRSEILAFCSARPVDGGTGAVYVLIKSL